MFGFSYIFSSLVVSTHGTSHLAYQLYEPHYQSIEPTTFKSRTKMTCQTYSVPHMASLCHVGWGQQPCKVKLFPLQTINNVSYSAQYLGPEMS